MADNGPSPMDMGAQLFARGINGGQNNAATPMDVNGESDILKLVEEGANKMMSALAKIFPFLPVNPGQVSLTSSFDTQGFLAKNIVQSTGPKGGVAAQFVFGTLLKNKSITDQTGGISPAAAQNMMASMQSFSNGDLGSFVPMSTPGMGQAIGAGMDIG